MALDTGFRLLNIDIELTEVGPLRRQSNRGLFLSSTLPLRIIYGPVRTCKKRNGREMRLSSECCSGADDPSLIISWGGISTFQPVLVVADHKVWTFSSPLFPHSGALSSSVSRQCCDNMPSSRSVRTAAKYAYVRGRSRHHPHVL